MDFLASTAIALVLTSGAPIDDPLIAAALDDSRALCQPGGGYLHAGSGGAPVHAFVGTHVQYLGHGPWVLADVAFPSENEVRHPVRVLLMGGRDT